MLSCLAASLPHASVSASHAYRRPCFPWPCCQRRRSATACCRPPTSHRPGWRRCRLSKTCTPSGCSLGRSWPPLLRLLRPRSMRSSQPVAPRAAATNHVWPSGRGACRRGPPSAWRIIWRLRMGQQLSRACRPVHSGLAMTATRRAPQHGGSAGSACCCSRQSRWPPYCRWADAWWRLLLHGRPACLVCCCCWHWCSNAIAASLWSALSSGCRAAQAPPAYAALLHSDSCCRRTRCGRRGSGAKA